MFEASMIDTKLVPSTWPTTNLMSPPLPLSMALQYCVNPPVFRHRLGDANIPSSLNAAGATCPEAAVSPAVGGEHAGVHLQLRRQCLHLLGLGGNIRLKHAPNDDFKPIQATLSSSSITKCHLISENKAANTYFRLHGILPATAKLFPRV